MTDRRTNAAIIGRIVPSRSTELNAARVLHDAQSRWHRWVWRRDVKTTGYCSACSNTAHAVFDAMVGQGAL